MRPLALILAGYVLTGYVQNTFATEAGKDPRKRLVIIGDSLTEGYGVAREKAFPALLQKKLDQAGKRYLVVNSGISGSTSASAPGRMRWQLRNKPDLILLVLGANDGLRGLSLKAMENHLNTAVALAKDAKVRVILAGMRMPPNYGETYTRDFAAVFPAVAGKHGVPLIPFILEGVGGKTEFNLSDGIHPNEKGHEIVANTVFAALKEHL